MGGSGKLDPMSCGNSEQAIVWQVMNVVYQGDDVRESVDDRLGSCKAVIMSAVPFVNTSTPKSSRTRERTCSVWHARTGSRARAKPARNTRGSSYVPDSSKQPGKFVLQNCCAHCPVAIWRKKRRKQSRQHHARRKAQQYAARSASLVCGPKIATSTLNGNSVRTAYITFGGATRPPAINKLLPWPEEDDMTCRSSTASDEGPTGPKVTELMKPPWTSEGNEQQRCRQSKEANVPKDDDGVQSIPSGNGPLGSKQQCA